MAKSQTVDLTNGNIKKQIFRFSLPIVISNIANELYNLTNSLIVGNYVSLEALSAVSACTWICNIFSYTFYGLGLGCGILVGRYYGAKDETNLKKTLDTSLIFGFVFGISLTILSELFLPQIMTICNIGESIFDSAYSYLRVYLLSNTFLLVSNIVYNILRSFGDSKHQLYYSIVGSITNLLLGFVFVRVLDMNVVGTSLATTISQGISLFLALRLLINFKEINIDIKHLNFSFEIVKKIFSLGLPAGFQNMLIAISSMLIQSYINMFPNEIIAGIGVGEKINNWAQAVSAAVAAATTALVAQNYGAKKYDRVQEAIKTSLKISTIITCAFVAIIWIIAPFAVAGFNDSAEVIKCGTNMIRISVFGMIFVNFSHIYNAACRGAGNVKAPMFVAIAGQVISKYLFVYIGLKISHNVNILYMGSAIGYLAAGTFAALYFNLSRWTFENQLRS